MSKKILTLDNVPVINKKIGKIDTIEKLKASTIYSLGDVVEVLGFHAKGDGSHHKRVAKDKDDGSGELGQNGIWWCIVDSDVTLGTLGGELTQDNLTYLADKKIRNIKYLKSNTVALADAKEISRFSLKTEDTPLAQTKIESMYTCKEKQFGAKSFSGTFNFNSKTLQNLKIAMKRNDTIKIVLFGDSIFGGADYSNYREIPNRFGYAHGVDNKEVNSSVAKQIVDHIFNALKGFKVDIYNRAIPGMGYMHIDTNVEALRPNVFIGREHYDTTKTWYENVVLCEPHLVIHHFGMNHISTDFLNQAVQRYFSKTEVVNRKFDTALITTLAPSTYMTESYVFSKEYIAQNQRQLARKYGCYLLDVAKASSIYRRGIDETVVLSTAEEEKFYLSDANVVSDVVHKPQGTGGLVKIHNPYNRLYRFLKFKTTVVGSNQILQLRFGKNLIQFYGNKVEFYDTNTTLLKTASNSFYTLSNKVSEIQLAFTPSSISVWIDTRHIFTVEGIFYEGYDQTFSKGDVNGDVTIECVTEYKSMRPSYSTQIFDDECWDMHQSSTHWGTEGYGGGINHPSSYAVANLYTPVFNEMAKDITSIDIFSKSIFEINKLFVDNEVVIPEASMKHKYFNFYVSGGRLDGTGMQSCILQMLNGSQLIRTSQFEHIEIKQVDNKFVFKTNDTNFRYSLSLVSSEF